MDHNKDWIKEVKEQKNILALLLKRQYSRYHRHTVKRYKALKT